MLLVATNEGVWKRKTIIIKGWKENITNNKIGFTSDDLLSLN